MWQFKPYPDQFDGLFSDDDLFAWMRSVMPQLPLGALLPCISQQIICCKDVRIVTSADRSVLQLDPVVAVIQGKLCASDSALTLELDDEMKMAYLHPRLSERSVSSSDGPVGLLKYELILNASPVGEDGSAGLPCARLYPTEPNSPTRRLDESWWPNVFAVGSDRRSAAAAKQAVSDTARLSASLRARAHRLDRIGWPAFIAAAVDEAASVNASNAKRLAIVTTAVLAENDSEAWAVLKSVLLTGMPNEIGRLSLVSDLKPISTHEEDGGRKYVFDCSEIRREFGTTQLVFAAKADKSCTASIECGADRHNRPLPADEARQLGFVESHTASLWLPGADLIAAGIYRARE